MPRTRASRRALRRYRRGCCRHGVAHPTTYRPSPGAPPRRRRRPTPLGNLAGPFGCLLPGRTGTYLVLGVAALAWLLVIVNLVRWALR